MFLLRDDAGRERLRRYFEPYLELCAATPGAGFLLDTATWRASADWGHKLAYDARALVRANLDAAALARAGGRPIAAARELGLSRQGLTKLLARLDLPTPEPPTAAALE